MVILKEDKFDLYNDVPELEFTMGDIVWRIFSDYLFEGYRCPWHPSYSIPDTSSLREERIMFLSKKRAERGGLSSYFLGLATGLMGFLVAIGFCGSVSARVGGFYGATIWPSDAYEKNQNTYRSPEGAVKALVDAMSANDEKKLMAILGPKGKRLFFSGDEADERAARERFNQDYQEKNRIIKVSSKEAVLEIGNEDRPFPIPIQKVGNHWRFSAREGRIELLKLPDQQK